MREYQSFTHLRRYQMTFLLLMTYTAGVTVVTLPLIHWSVSMNFDTSVRLWVIQTPWRHLIHNVKYVELAPPVWHIGTKLAVSLSPFEPMVTVRLLNYLYYLTFVPVGYISGRIIEDHYTGLATAFLIPWNQLVFNFTTRIDHYMMFGLSTLIFTSSLLFCVDRPGDRRYTVVHAVVSTIYGTIHYYAALYVVGTTVFALIFVWDLDLSTLRSLSDVSRIKSQLPWGRTRASSRVWHLFGATVPLGFFYVSWIPAFLYQYRAYRTVFGGDPTLNPLIATARAVSLTSRYLGNTIYPRPVIIALTVCLLFLVVARALITDNRRLLAVIGGTMSSLIIVFMIGGLYAPRHAFFLAGIVPLFVAYVLRGGAAIILSTISDGSQWPRFAVTILVVSLLVTPSAAAGVSLDTPERDTDLQAVTEFVDSHVTDRTVVLSSHPWGEMILESYGVDQSVPIYGVPRDAVGSRHRVRPVRDRTQYAPDSHPSDYRRLQARIGGARRIILFDARGHPYGLYEGVPADLRELGYHRVDEIRVGPNGASVFHQNGTETTAIAGIPGHCSPKTPQKMKTDCKR